MSMVGRRGLLKTLGLAPLARSGKHKHRETPVGWTNQAFQLLIVNAADGSFSGAFVYSPGPGHGNLIASIAASSGTDPYGNSYVAGITSYGASDFSYAELASAALTFFSTNPATKVTNVGGVAFDDALTISAQPDVHVTSPSTRGAVAGISTVWVLGEASGAGTVAQVVINTGTSASPATLALLEVQGTASFELAFLPEQSSAPATPSGGGILYTDSTGHLHYLGPGGTNTTLAGP